MPFDIFKPFFKQFHTHTHTPPSHCSWQCHLHGSLWCLNLPSQYCPDLCQANQQNRGEAGLHSLESTQTCCLGLTTGLLSSNIYPSLHLTGFTPVELLNKLLTSPTPLFLHPPQFPVPICNTLVIKSCFLLPRMGTKGSAFTYLQWNKYLEGQRSLSGLEIIPAWKHSSTNRSSTE